MLKPFHLLEPTTVAEATSQLNGEQTRVYAGGAELILLLRHGLLDVEALVNIKHIAELGQLSWEGTHLRIGATVSHRRLETDPLVRRHLPMLADAESHIGNIRVRSQGTLGGNLCFADPHADPATALLVHQSRVGVAGKKGSRELPLEEFLVGMYETALKADELLTEVCVPALPEGWSHAYLRIERFYRPTVNVASAGLANGEKLKSIRLAVGCVGAKAQRLHDLEAQLSGLSLQEAEQAALASKPYLERELHPIDDLLGSADYKLHITSVLLKKALGRIFQDRERDNGG